MRVLHNNIMYYEVVVGIVVGSRRFFPHYNNIITLLLYEYVIHYASPRSRRLSPGRWQAQLYTFPPSRQNMTVHNNITGTLHIDIL